MDFGDCLEGVPYCKTLSIVNDSSCLDLAYKIKAPAHFKTDDKGCLQPQSKKELIIVFRPRQFGNHDGFLTIEIVGESTNGLQPITKYKIPLKGTCIVEGGISNKNSKMQIAQLNDLPSSIKPHDRQIVVR